MKTRSFKICLRYNPEEDDLLVFDLVAKDEAENSGHVFQTDSKGLGVFKYVYVFSKYPSKKENSKDVGNYHLEHNFTISEEYV